MIRRDIFITTPSPGDYLLNTTGLTWNVDQTTANGVFLRVIAGERSRNSARARLLVLAERDSTDGWESFGTGSYRLIERRRIQAV